MTEFLLFLLIVLIYAFLLFEFACGLTEEAEERIRIDCMHAEVLRQAAKERSNNDHC